MWENLRYRIHSRSANNADRSEWKRHRKEGWGEWGGEREREWVSEWTSEMSFKYFSLKYWNWFVPFANGGNSVVPLCGSDLCEIKLHPIHSFIIYIFSVMCKFMCIVYWENVESLPSKGSLHFRTYIHFIKMCVIFSFFFFGKFGGKKLFVLFLLLVPIEKERTKKKLPFHIDTCYWNSMSKTFPHGFISFNENTECKQ